MHDALKAEQCWQGFLFWGRWLGGFTERLLPLFDEAISRLEVFPKKLRERAIDHIAGLALFRFEDPLTSGWLGKILPKLSTEDRDHLAHAVHHLLNDTDPHIAEKIWDRWLKNYWEMRLLGTPMPLSSTEAAEMVFWAVSFGCRVPEAVKFVQRMADRVTFEHTDLLLRINQKGIAKSQPEACAELVLFFLQCNPRYFFVADYVSTVWQDLKTSGVSEEKLQKIREAMFALGHDPEQLSA